MPDEIKKNLPHLHISSCSRIVKSDKDHFLKIEYIISYLLEELIFLEKNHDKLVTDW